MKLSFLGAAREVTGSCHYLEACGKKILIDCGMQQGSEFVSQELPIIPAEVDFVLLTHAHIDHSGRLPLLSRYGFRGEVHATGATANLCSIMLQDSAHIQEFEAEWRNRKGKRSGKDAYEPLYTMEDAQAVLSLFVPHPYGEMEELCPGIRFRFVDAGHLLGSASIEVWVTEAGVTRKLVFSGDIGNLNQPLIRDPQYIREADYVVMESTYGDRDHDTPPDYRKALAAVIQETFDKGGNVVIPSFAVGRTQELLYFIRDIVAEHLVKGYDAIPVYVDSPLAIEATNIFNRNVMGYFDEEAMELVSRGINPIAFPGLTTATTSDESKAINFDPKPKVIISASGMCEAGRIKHHLKHNLWRPECTVVFVGYQANGTLGRALLEGAKEVKLFGEEIEVRASIIRLEGISGHADREGLLRWIGAFDPRPKQVFVVHGDSEVSQEFAERLRQGGYPAKAPLPGASYDLISGQWLEEGRMPERKSERAGAARASAVYQRLVAAGQRLLAVIRASEGRANKDLAKFADQVDALAEKWGK